MEHSQIQPTAATPPAEKLAEPSKQPPKKKLGLSTIFALLIACFVLNTIATIRQWRLVSSSEILEVSHHSRHSRHSPHRQRQQRQQRQQQRGQNQQRRHRQMQEEHLDGQHSERDQQLRHERLTDSKSSSRHLQQKSQRGEEPALEKQEHESNESDNQNNKQQPTAVSKKAQFNFEKWKKIEEEKENKYYEAEEEDDGYNYEYDDDYLFDVNQVPYYLQGKDMGRILQKLHASKEQNLEQKKIVISRKEIMGEIVHSPVESMMEDGKKDSTRQLNKRTDNNDESSFHLQTYALPHYIHQMTRNHDSVFLGDDPTYTNIYGEPDNRVISVLGRHSRYIQWLDVMTGESGRERTKGLDPAGWPLDDLNHVNAVLVDVIEGVGDEKQHQITNRKSSRKRKEIWVPCGFHGDEVNNETSTSYTRIIDVDTLTTRAGPKLPHTTATQGGGGACVATALQILPDEPPMICMFSGTRGTHDAGYFLPQTACYDRLRSKWWDPFGNLPYGMDHANLVVVPPNRCRDGRENEPAKILIFNFRTKPYGDCHPEFLAYDLPKSGWTLEQLQKNEETFGEREGEWYAYHVTTDLTLPQNIPRDASGIVVANNGRTVLNFAGTAHKMVTEYDEESNKMVQKRKRVRFSMIRAFDVCTKTWTQVGDIGLGTLAIQSAGSEKLQVAITVGGEAPTEKFNSPFCFVSRLDSSSDAGKFRIDNQHKVVEYIGV